MRGYILSEPARRDLYHIRDYIAQDNVVAARKVVQEIRAAFQVIAWRLRQ
jgi:plasmid stabilization system protein ParE